MQRSIVQSSAGAALNSFFALFIFSCGYWNLPYQGSVSLNLVRTIRCTRIQKCELHQTTWSFGRRARMESHARKLSACSVIIWGGIELEPWTFWTILGRVMPWTINSEYKSVQLSQQHTTSIVIGASNDKIKLYISTFLTLEIFRQISIATSERGSLLSTCYCTYGIR